MTTEINNTEAVITQTPTPVVPVMTPAVPVNHGEKPEKFNGNDFKRWQQKMIFYLTILNLARFTHEKAPTLNEGETDRQVVVVVDAWKHGNYLYRNYILNGLDNTLYNAKANVVEHGQGSKLNNKKRKHDDSGPKQGSTSKINKGINNGFKDKCFVCGKDGHRSKDCHVRKDEGSSNKNPAQANIAEDFYLSDGVADINLTAVVFEANLVGNPKEWWVDTGATRHICADKKMFTTYKVVESEEQLFMGNSSTSTVEGQGKIVLKMTLGKKLTLNNCHDSNPPL
ncbi:hypothetical protein CsSME_00003331 [Camellia sinensis var. sinensis]